jgi:8-oxo-dGTP pyrophosphatase MutT (NUDIX family)
VFFKLKWKITKEAFTEKNASKSQNVKLGIFLLFNHKNMEKEYLQVFVAAAVIIERDYKYLFVQEKKEEAYGLWNLPAGRVEIGETIEEAAVREVKEETGYVVTLTAKVGIFHESHEHGVKHVYAGEITNGDLELPEDEIMDAQWFSFEEVVDMGDQVRMPWVLDAVRLYESQFKNFA